MSGPALPPSVQLGEVVPPEDPEDWGRPLTWALAAGMLVGPLAGAAWFWVAAPVDPATAMPGVAVLGATAAVGATVVGALQRGAPRAILSTLGAGLFAALGLVLAGSVIAAGVALPTAVVAAVAGFGGSLAAASLAGLLVGASRPRRMVSPAVAAALAAAVVSQLLVGG